MTHLCMKMMMAIMVCPRHMYPRTFFLARWTMRSCSIRPERCVPTPIETMGQQIYDVLPFVMHARLAVILRRALTATLFSLVSLHLTS
jgi:hypothetical protein